MRLAQLLHVNTECLSTDKPHVPEIHSLDATEQAMLLSDNKCGSLVHDNSVFAYGTTIMAVCS